MVNRFIISTLKNKPDFRKDPRCSSLKAKYWDEYVKQLNGGSYEYNLYHDEKNGSQLGLTVLVTPVIFVFAGGGVSGGIMWSAIVWGVSLLVCWLRDQVLEQDQEVQRMRSNCFRSWLIEKGYFNPYEDTEEGEVK